MQAHFCANCGTALAPGARFCAGCGTSLQAPAAYAAPQQPPVAPSQPPVAVPAPPPIAAPAPETPPLVFVGEPKVGFHWGYGISAIIVFLIGAIVASSGSENDSGVAVVIGLAMMAVAALSGILSSGFRKVEGHPGFTAFLIKAPAYGFVGIGALIGAMFSNWLRRQAGGGDEPRQ